MTTSDPESAATTATHSCEHCSGHGDAPDPTAKAATHLALARRRLLPRLALGILLLPIAMVVAQRQEGGFGAGVAAWALPMLFVASGIAWVLSAIFGMQAGAALTKRSAAAQLALGRVLAAVIAAIMALGIGFLAGLSDPGFVPVVIAAGGWFLAATVGEVIGIRGLSRRINQQTPEGAFARFHAEQITLAGIQRNEVIGLGLAVAFGLATGVLNELPLLALVLVPLAGAGAAWFGLRRSRAVNASA